MAVLKEDGIKMASELFAAQEALRGHGAGVSYRKINIDRCIDRCIDIYMCMYRARERGIDRLYRSIDK